MITDITLEIGAADLAKRGIFAGVDGNARLWIGPVMVRIKNTANAREFATILVEACDALDKARAEKGAG